MRLLSKKDSENKKAVEESEKIKKLSSLDKEISGKVNEINILKDNKNKKIDQINDDIIKLEADFNGFKDELREKKEVLVLEVKELEKRKEKALEPIEAREKEVAKREQESKQEIERLDGITLNLNDLNQKITQGYEDLQDKKTDLDSREQEIEKQEKSIKKQLEFSDKSIKELNQKWVEFREAELKWGGEILIEKKEVELQRTANNILKAELDKRQSEIDTDRLRLESQQQALSAAFAEARSKNLL